MAWIVHKESGYSPQKDVKIFNAFLPGLILDPLLEQQMSEGRIFHAI
jgi:hypothetical protein